METNFGPLSSKSNTKLEFDVIVMFLPFQCLGLLKIKIGSLYLKWVVKTKSLGLIIDDKLRWEEHRLYLLQDKTEHWHYQKNKGCDTH